METSHHRCQQQITAKMTNQMTTIPSPEFTTASFSRNHQRLHRSRRLLPLIFISGAGMLMVLTGCNPSLLSTTAGTVPGPAPTALAGQSEELTIRCLLYTSDAADE